MRLNSLFLEGTSSSESKEVIYRSNPRSIPLQDVHEDFSLLLIYIYHIFKHLKWHMHVNKQFPLH